MTNNDFTAIYLTLQLATVTTILLLLLATPIAWWLAWTRSPWRTVISALVNLPLVLPPTVLGFYLLLFLGPQGWIGQLTTAMGLRRLPFTFYGLIAGSVVFSLPFALQPIQYAFEALGRRPLEVAATLRAGPLDRFFTIALPLAWPGFITAAILVFAHTIGEFGVVLMLGGNIPGQTQTIAIALYNHVEAMEYAPAHWLAGSLTGVAFLALLCVNWLKTRHSDEHSR